MSSKLNLDVTWSSLFPSNAVKHTRGPHDCLRHDAMCQNSYFKRIFYMKCLVRHNSTSGQTLGELVSMNLQAICGYPFLPQAPLQQVRYSTIDALPALCKVEDIPYWVHVRALILCSPRYYGLGYPVGLAAIGAIFSRSAFSLSIFSRPALVILGFLVVFPPREPGPVALPLPVSVPFRREAPRPPREPTPPPRPLPRPRLTVPSALLTLLA